MSAPIILPAPTAGLGPPSPNVASNAGQGASVGFFQALLAMLLTPGVAAPPIAVAADGTAGRPLELPGEGDAVSTAATLDMLAALWLPSLLTGADQTTPQSPLTDGEAGPAQLAAGSSLARSLSLVPDILQAPAAAPTPASAAPLVAEGDNSISPARQAASSPLPDTVPPVLPSTPSATLSISGAAPTLPPAGTPPAREMAVPGGPQPAAPAVGHIGSASLAPPAPAEATGTAPLAALATESLGHRPSDAAAAKQRAQEGEEALPLTPSAADLPAGSPVPSGLAGSAAVLAEPAAVADGPTSAPLSPAAVDELVEHVRLTRVPGQTSLRLTLRPAWLGEVEVNIHVTERGAAIQLSALRPEAQSTIEHQLPVLRSALEAGGVTVERLTVDSGTVSPGGGMNFDLARQGHPHRHEAAPQATARFAAGALPAVVEPTEPSVRAPLSAPRGAIDYRV